MAVLLSISPLLFWRHEHSGNQSKTTPKDGIVNNGRSPVVGNDQLSVIGYCGGKYGRWQMRPASRAKHFVQSCMSSLSPTGVRAYIQSGSVPYPKRLWRKIRSQRTLAHRPQTHHTSQHHTSHISDMIVESSSPHRIQDVNNLAVTSKDRPNA